MHGCPLSDNVPLGEITIMTIRNDAPSVWLCLCAVVFVFGLVGCSDDDPTDPGDGLEPLALTLNLGASVVAEFGPIGHVFASSTDGEVLATATWEGAGPVVLTSDDGEYDLVTYTVVGFEGHDLQTFRPVPPNSEQAVLGAEYTGLYGNAFVNVQNPPPHSEYFVSTNGSTGYNYTPMGEQLVVHISGPISDVYVCLSTVDGPVGAFWVRDVAIDAEVTVDLAVPGVLEALQTRTITPPDVVTGDNVSWRMARAYPEGAWPEIISLSTGSLLEAPYDITAWVPADTWASDELSTQIVVHTGDEDSYAYVLTGDWPATLPTVDSEVTLLHSADGLLEWEWVDDLHRADGLWQLSIQDAYARWDIAGWGGPESSLELPQLPAAVTEAWSHLVRDDFTPTELLLEQDVSDTLTLRVGAAWPEL